MLRHWFKRPTSFWIPLVVLSLLFVIACGSAAQQTSTEATEAVKTTEKDQAMAAPTAVPLSQSEPQMPETKLQRVVVAVSPMGWDTNFTYRVSTTGLLDKRPVQEMLIGIDRVTGAYEPQLAEKWEMAPNGMDWTFTLRKGVSWHGEAAKPGGWGEFTARDVRHTAFMHTNPDSIASNGDKWREIVGVTKADRKANSVELIQNKAAEAVEILDDYTVVIHSKTVQPELYYYHSVNRGYPIVSKARYDSLGKEEIGQAIVGTGPLKFVQRKEAQHVLYEAVEDHWRVTPQYNELEFRWVAESATRLATLITGEVHMADVERVLQAQAREQGMNVMPSKFPGMNVSWGFYGQYQTVPEYLDPDLPWLDVRVRRAMQKAVDTEGIVAALMAGSEVQYPSIYGYHPMLDVEMWSNVWNPKWFEDWEEYYGYDPEKAKELLAEAGYPNGFEFTIHLTPLSGLPEIVDIGQAIAVDFQKIGLKPKLEELDYPVSAAMARAHKASGVLRPSRSSHRTILSATSYSTKNSSTHIYTNPEIDKVIEELERTVDNRKRGELLRKMGDIQYYDNARLQMFGLFVEMMVNPEYIANYEFPSTMSGYFSHLEYIETVPQ
jgi:ABC-type transport system substrate-binding protein